MYIEKIEIKKFRVLENMEGDNALYFQPPGGLTADPETGNVVNVIAGVNGCGKTSILDLLSDLPKAFLDFRNRKNNNGMFILSTPNVEVVINDIERMSNNESILFSTNKGKFQVRYSELPSINNTPGEMLEYFNLVYFDFDRFSRKNTKKQSYAIVSNESIYKDIEEVIANYLLFLERTIHEENPELRSKKALERFNSIFNDIDFYTKLHVVSYGNGKMKPEFINANGEKVNLSDLSDGEQRLYMSAMELMRYFHQDYIILMDEPEISLHPAWQQKIMRIYSRIGKNNQFIVATHSPQIIANTLYKNLIILRKEEGKIIPFYPSRPPIGTDVNSILDEFMGISDEYPEFITVWHDKYREKVRLGIEESDDDAKKILSDLLKYESNNSRFLQEMAIIKKLRSK
jgi:predicted ATP-binding protein involved in virulence